jgi:hypothetical protein
MRLNGKNMRGEQVKNVGESVVWKQLAAWSTICLSVTASSKNTVFLSLCQGCDKDSLKSLHGCLHAVLRKSLSVTCKIFIRAKNILSKSCREK